MDFTNWPDPRNGLTLIMNRTKTVISQSCIQTKDNYIITKPS